jgi:electron transfer flavoprotein alpha subunit
MPKETYVGVSGLMLAPEVYIALGISGQVQHTVGVNRSKVVIAINKDKNAPIFKQADYGIVGDLYKVVPAMINKLK